MNQTINLNDERVKRGYKPLNQGQIDALTRYNTLGMKMWLIEDRYLTSLECSMSLLGITPPAESIPLRKAANASHNKHNHSVFIKTSLHGVL